MDIVASLERVALSRFYSTGTDTASIKDYIKTERILLAYIQDNLVGKISYKIELGSVYISGLVVLPEWRGKGLGAALSQHVIELFPHSTVFRLTVHPENLVAVVIYQKLGFVLKQQIVDYYGDGEPRAVMELRR